MRDRLRTNLLLRNERKKTNMSKKLLAIAACMTCIIAMSAVSTSALVDTNDVPSAPRTSIETRAETKDVPDKKSDTDTDIETKDTPSNTSDTDKKSSDTDKKSSDTDKKSSDTDKSKSSGSSGSSSSSGGTSAGSNTAVAATVATGSIAGIGGLIAMLTSSGGAGVFALKKHK